MADDPAPPAAFARVQSHLLSKEFGATPDYWLSLSSENFFLAWEHHKVLEAYRNPQYK